jgi:hypothetical protein
MTSGRRGRSVLLMKTLIVTALLVFAVAATAVATASSRSAVTSIELVQHDAHFQFVDVAPRGGVQKPPSEGDEYVIGGSLSEAGKPAGTSNLVCTVTQPGRAGASECVGSIVVAGGTISMSGFSRIATNGDVFAVTGGTGRYVGATGTVVSSQGKGGADDLAIRLR